MSASELAPFVAAIIDDGIAPELKRKIDVLEATIQDRDHERLLVQITGRDGHPIYGEKSLKHGIPKIDEDGFENLWLLKINNEDDAIICPFDEEPITQLEIRVGGMLIMSRVLEQLVMIAHPHFQEHDDEDDLDKLVYVEDVAIWSTWDFNGDDIDENDCPINRILARVGPITVRHYKALRKITSGIETSTSDLFEHNVLPTTATAGAQPTRKITLAVTQIEFNKKNISGCISLMKQLGIRTLRREPRSL